MFAVGLAFITAIALAGVAAWFSITGLMAIFAGLPVAVAIMAGVLEVAKLVTASVLYRNWNTIPKLVKTYLSIAIVILMLITSLGIFGYLSKAHIEQGAPVSNNFAKIERLEQRIEREQRAINDAEKVIAQLDSTITTLIEYDKISGPTGARAVREGQQVERDAMNAIVDKSQSNIDDYLDEKATYEQEVRNFEREIGPIKYIAALAYSNPEDHYEDSVRYIILLLIFVFDPLAVLLLITANHIQMQRKVEIEFEDDIEDDSMIVVDEPTYNTISEALDAEPEISERLRKLMSSTPPWEDEPTSTSVKITDDDLVDVTQDDVDLLNSFEIEEPKSKTNSAINKLGYTTFAELSVQDDETILKVIALLNNQELTRTLTPTEYHWRSAARNIIERRRRNNPLQDVRNTDENIG